MSPPDLEAAEHFHPESGWAVNRGNISDGLSIDAQLPAVTSFVALGDSFTEGMSDVLPDG